MHVENALKIKFATQMIRLIVAELEASAPYSMKKINQTAALAKKKRAQHILLNHSYSTSGLKTAVNW